MNHKADAVFVPLNIAVLTVSDTRTLETDTSGQLLVDRLTAAGHQLAERVLLKDDLYKIRAQVATWIAEDQVQVLSLIHISTEHQRQQAGGQQGEQQYAALDA